MNKRTFLVSLLTSMIVIMLCGGCSNVTDMYTPKLENSENILYVCEPDEVKGFNEEYQITKLTIGDVLYRFEGRSNEENLKLSEGMDALLRVAMEEYGFNRMPQSIIFSQDEYASLDSTSISINPENPYSLGAVFFFVSGERLPAWLAAGLELYWSERKGFERFNSVFDVEGALSRKVETIGDEWFIEGFLGAGMNKDSISILYGFTAHLSQVGALSKLQTLLEDGALNAGTENFRISEWSNFSGNEADFSRMYHYRYGNGVLVRTLRGEYNFLEAPWTMNLIESRVNFLDNSTAFAFEWFAIEQETIPRIILEPWLETGIGGRYGRGRITLYGVFSYQPTASTHEIVHYIQQNYSVGTGFSIYMYDGLAEAIRVRQAMEEEEFATYWHLDFLRGFPCLAKWDYEEQPYLRLVVELSQRLWEANCCEDMDATKWTNLFALRSIQRMYETEAYPRFMEGGFRGSPIGRPQDSIDGFLFTYPTATSFVLFLLEIGTREELLQFYGSSRLAEDIYGMDLEALIYVWLYEYLEWERFQRVYADLAEQ